MNLQDAERRGLTAEILLLAGSAINSIRTPQGVTDPRYGAEAMLQALEVHRSGVLADTPITAQTEALMDVATIQEIEWRCRMRCGSGIQRSSHEER